MTGPELLALAERLETNPYFLAYAFATGAKSAKEAFDRDGGNHEFIIWNNERWAEQCILEKLPRDVISIQPGAIDRHCALCATFVPDGATAGVSMLDTAPTALRGPL